MKINTFHLFTLLFALLMILGTGCDLYEQDEYRELVQIESYLVAGRQLPVVRITRTLPIDVEYTFESAALSGAIVSITLLDENGGTAEVFPYESGAATGIYIPQDDTHIVEARRSYRIDVTFSNRDEQLSAVTTVPDQISVINDVRESVVYQSDEQLEIVLAPTVQTQNQNVFVFDALALNPTPESLTPFYLAAVNDGDAEIEDFFSNSSGLINEGNFDIMADGTIFLNFPWIGAAFYGETTVVTNSVDRNVAELLRSQEVQLGGSTLSPGEIPNLRYNIDGGIGVFGSISSDSVVTNFLRP
ncbi:DUF4249 family protein [Rhodohalobacter mucosus]|uniref:DUF4249 family protein n=1 Tax=Rhodohalobacter mucosus TaxID=2079485 RepID=A0A316TPR5_9BACT|nr:DUF4249 family protein [Rhodohalobacter mucosus]PWN06380.1 hypothetical protein DDZ15_11205 [Rhodohalobacter mucosus]